MKAWSKILGQLFAAFFFVVSLSLLIFYFALTPKLKALILDEMGTTLSQKVDLIRDRLENLPSGDWDTEHMDALADQLALMVQARVTLLDDRGRVLGDSKLDTRQLQKLDNHLLRPEVQAALTQKFGMNTRFSDTIQTNMMYVAMRTSRGFARIALPMEVMDQTMDGVKRSVFISALVALGLSGLAGFFISRSITGSLTEMSEVAQRIALGDFSRRVLFRKKNELGDLARAINEMGVDLEKQFQELSAEQARLAAILNGMTEGVLVTNQRDEIVLVNPALLFLLKLDRSCVGKRIMECFRNEHLQMSLNQVIKSGRFIESEFRVLVDEHEKIFIVRISPLNFIQTGGVLSVFSDVTQMRRLENTRREFVANVSHELKTPLTSIRGYAETLLQGALDDRETSYRFVEKMAHNAGQLGNLVEDILKLSEIESGRLEKQFIQVDLRSCGEEVASNFSLEITKKKLYFLNEIPKKIEVYADVLALKTILSNLIDNAIKYTPHGGQLTLGAQREGAFSRVIVADTGIGIDQKYIPHLFERFYRVDKARSREVGGTGLGLAIVKHLVQVHGGEVSVTSEFGKGSQFSFTIPLSMATQ